MTLAVVGTFNPISTNQLTNQHNNTPLYCGTALHSALDSDFIVPSTVVSMVTVGNVELSVVILSSTVNIVELSVAVVSSTDGIVIPNPITTPVMFDLHMICI